MVSAGQANDAPVFEHLLAHFPGVPARRRAGTHTA
jgi:hypothetical protein